MTNEDTITYKLDQLLKAVDGIDKKVDSLSETVTRHDERITTLQTRNIWAGGVFTAALSYLIKDKLHL